MRHKTIVVNIKMMTYVLKINIQNKLFEDNVVALQLNVKIYITSCFIFLLINTEGEKQLHFELLHVF